MKLFGVDAGKELNDFVEIIEIDPECVFSQNRQMVFGHKENIKGFSIGKWLSMRPLAAACMSLKFKSVPTEAPVDAKIIVEMEVEGGKILRDTSKVVGLTP